MADNIVAGKMLFVDLTSGTFTDEPITDHVYRQYLGGYGIGAKVLYERMKPGIDPLGPDNILGFVAGLLTGTGAISSGRFAVVGRSPLTGAWGDSNCGGYFGPQLRKAGYDALFFTGSAENPVYLLLDNGRPKLIDACGLWGKDAYETEQAIKQAHAARSGRIEVACIGPAGEKRSLISCILTDRGRAAGRSGLGAVMGSKNLKAVAVCGEKDIRIVDKQALRQVNRIVAEAINRPDNLRAAGFKRYGTCGGTLSMLNTLRTPIKNWGGISEDFPGEKAETLSGEEIIKCEKRKYGCHGCPIKCGGIIEQSEGEFAISEESHKPEYETVAAFGPLCLNNNLESIIAANDICNRYGLDTISAGATLAFAVECYENGVITKEDAGVALRWGDADALLTLLKMMARREGFGDILADGVRVAAARIGRGAQRLAVHVGGQEIGMHHPRVIPAYATTYTVDATPGRHTAGGAQSYEAGLSNELLSLPGASKYEYARKGEFHVPMSALNQVITCAGLCQFPAFMVTRYPVVEMINAVTGWNITLQELLRSGERILMLRHCFNLREGFRPADFTLPERAKGEPHMNHGPLADVKLDEQAMKRSIFEVLAIDEITGYPSPEKLQELDLVDTVVLDR